jgi:hypothetical protein
MAKIRHPVERHAGEESAGTEHGGNTAQGADGTDMTNPSALASSANQAAMANARSQPQPT